MNEPALLDANLLVYPFFPKAPQYQLARKVLTRADFELFPEIEVIEPREF